MSIQRKTSSLNSRHGLALPKELTTLALLLIVTCPKVHSCGPASRCMFPDQVTNAMRVQMNCLSHCLLLLLHEEKVQSEDEAPGAHHSVIVLDPDIRSFLTMRDADGQAIKWGTAEEAKIILFLCRRPIESNEVNWLKRKKAKCLETRIPLRTPQNQEHDYQDSPQACTFAL